MADELQDLFASFSRQLRAEGRSPRTSVVYGQAVRFFSAWLAEQGKPATLEHLTRPEIREWLAGLADKHETSTVKTRYRSLFRFCGWLIDEGEIDEHPMKTLSAPQPKMKPVPVLSDAEISRLLKACKGNDFHHRRDEAIVRLLMDCGVRVSELCGLTVEGVNLDSEMALVMGKGNKIRPVYFSHRTTAALDRYRRIRSKHRWASLDQFFLTQRGGITPDGVRERMHVLGKLAGIEDLHPHQFRHTFAHDFLMAGGQERDLKRLAGWTSDSMLERYGASAADQRAKSAAQRMKRGDRV